MLCLHGAYMDSWCIILQNCTKIGIDTGYFQPHIATYIGLFIILLTRSRLWSINQPVLKAGLGAFIKGRPRFFPAKPETLPSRLGHPVLGHSKAPRNEFVKTGGHYRQRTNIYIWTFHTVSISIYKISKLEQAKHNDQTRRQNFCIFFILVVKPHVTKCLI